MFGTNREKLIFEIDLQTPSPEAEAASDEMDEFDRVSAEMAIELGSFVSIHMPDDLGLELLEATLDPELQNRLEAFEQAFMELDANDGN